MRHGEIHIQKAHKLGVSSNCLGDSLSGECLFTEPTLDRTKYFSVCGILFVKELTQGMISRAQAIAKVLREDPTAIYTKTKTKRSYEYSSLTIMIVYVQAYVAS